MTAKPHDARARIAEARRRQQNAELNAIMDEVDAELAESRREREATKPAVPEITEDEKRYQLKKEANDLVNKFHMAGPSAAFPHRYERPAPLHPDASGAEVAARLHV